MKRKQIVSWFHGSAERLAPVDVDGEVSYVLQEDLAALTDSAASTVVRLLPGYDQWVLGPGTADRHVVPPARRALVSRGANLVVAGGVLAGTWKVVGETLTVGWFPEAGPPPDGALVQEIRRISGILGRPLQAAVQPA